MNVFDMTMGAEYLIKFVKQYKIAKLNFAGPRESGAMGIQQFTKELVECFIDKLNKIGSQSICNPINNKNNNDTKT